MKNILKLSLLVLVIFGLSACQGDDTRADLDEVVLALEENLFVWNTVGFVNNMIYEENGEIIQHLKMTMYTDLNGQLYLEVEDLTDNSPTLVSYVYIPAENEDAYLYDNDAFYDQGSENYYIKSYEEIVEDIPQPSAVFSYLVHNLPKDDVENEALKLNEYRVKFNGDSVDVYLSFTFTDNTESETVVWKIEGDVEDFMFNTPQTNGADIRFFKSNFFDTFEGIDKDLHD